MAPWIAARQASLSVTNSRSLLRPTSIESVMPSSHLILCRPLLLLPPIPPSIRVLSNESTLRMRWPKYWSFSFSIIPSKEIPGLISIFHYMQIERKRCTISLLYVGLRRKCLWTIQKRWKHSCGCFVSYLLAFVSIVKSSLPNKIPIMLKKKKRKKMQLFINDECINKMWYTYY